MTSRLRCDECNMVFGSPALLQKHRSKFCVGHTAQVDIFTRRSHYDDRRSPSPQYTGRKSGTMKATQQQKLREIEDYKKKKTRMRDLRDLEERILLDSIQQTDHHTHGIPGERLNNRHLPRANDSNVRGLQLKYEQLQEQEKTLQTRAEPPTLKSRKPQSRQSLYSACSTNSSVTIYLPDDDDVPRYNPNQDAQARQLAETHGRQMEFLNSRNRELERQREDIRRRLEELGRRPVIIQKENAPPPPPPPPVKSDISTELLLQQLKDQETRNQKTLDELKRELFYLRDKKEVQPVIQQAPPPPPPQIIKLLNDSFNQSQVLVEKLQENLIELFADEYNFKKDVAVQYSDTFLQDRSLNSKRTLSTQGPPSRRTLGNRYQRKGHSSALSKISEHCSLLNNKDSTNTLVNTSAVFHKYDSPWQTYLNEITKCRLLSLKSLLFERRVALQTSEDGHSNPSMINEHTDEGMKTPYSGVASHSEIEKHVPAVPSKPTKNYIYPVYYGGSLVAEISAIRQAYLQNGGNDPEVLNNMALMLEEAKALEDAQKDGKRERVKEKKVDVVQGTQIQSMEFENERLQRELLLIQEQNTTNKQRNREGREDEFDRDLKRLQQEYLHRMNELQYEMELLRQQAALDRMRPRDPPPPPQQAPAPPVRQYVEVDPLAPYDPNAGFVIFYDFVMNLDSRVTSARLIIGLHSDNEVMGEPTILPTVYTEPTVTRNNYYYNFTNAVIGAKQPVPRCPAQYDLGIVVELQTSGGPASEYDQQRLITRAWTKIPLFDNSNRLISGRFRRKFRNVPIKPFLPFQEITNVPMYGEVELYYRIVNMRDASTHSLVTVSAANHDSYKALPEGYPPSYSLVHLAPKHPPNTISRHIITPTSLKDQHKKNISQDQHHLPPIQNPQQLPEPSSQPLPMTIDTSIGFQVDRIKQAEPGEGKVRLTAYYATTGKVVQSSTSPVTCSTTAVRSNFKYGYHVFGQQEAVFIDVDFQGDMILIARFYLKRKRNVYDDVFADSNREEHQTLYDNETLVAWAAIPLVLSDIQGGMTPRVRRTFDPTHMTINVGTHTLNFYQPPVPDVNRIPMDGTEKGQKWVRYGTANLKLIIFQGTPEPDGLADSDFSDDSEDTLPELSWLPLERKDPPRDPFLSGDGFDVYVDGCRHLPDSVTFSRVAGRIMDKKCEVYGQDIMTGVKLDSDIYNPVYEHKEEFRDTLFPPSSTLLFKVYTIDNFYKQLTVVGYATLNVFIEPGLDRQLLVDQPGMQMTLNEGAHQLRLYAQGPNGLDTFSETLLRDTGTRIIPCASLLVRLSKVPTGPGGKPLLSSQVPEANWLRLGLWQPRPKYTDRIYYSMKCVPTKGESKLFHFMMRRPKVSIREAVGRVVQASDSFMKSENDIQQYIKNQLTKSVDKKAMDQDLNFIAQYNPKQGLMVSVDSAVNLPWSSFTHAHICLNPPGAFYMGTPNATYDRLTFTEMLDMQSTNTSPAWRDGFKTFHNRSYHRFLTVIIHLQEIAVTLTRENYKYGLMEQAWTVIGAFLDKYAITQTFQLPLFQGGPSQQMLKQLAREPCKDWIERNIRNNNLKLIPGASLFVRLCDTRRDDELISHIVNDKLVEVNTDYLPQGMDKEYTQERPGQILSTLVPQGKTAEMFSENLASKFKSLVYKLYEEGNV